MTKKIIPFVVLFFLETIVVSAQTELSLSQAINHALEHKLEAKKAQLEIENSQYLIEETRANALPQINGHANLTRNAILQQMAMDFGGQTMVIRMGLPWQSTATVQLDQQIFNMAVFQGLKAAKTTRDFYLINAQLTEEQIVEKVANSYFEVYKTKSQIKTIENTIENTDRVYNVLSNLHSSGLARKIDLDRISVARNNLITAKQQLQNAISLQENALKYLIGMDLQTEIVMPENTFEIDLNTPLERITGIETRTEIALLTQQGALLQLNKKAIDARRYPTLALTANYGYLGLGQKMPYFAGESQGVYWSDFSAIGLNLNVPIFSGFANRARVRQAQIQIDQFEAEMTDVKQALALSAENAYTQMRNAIATLNSQEENMALAKDVLDNIENNYQNGLATLTDLLDAETSYADAQNNHTNAIMDYKLAEIQLIKAKGELRTLYTPNTK